KINYADNEKKVIHDQCKNSLDSFIKNYIFKDEKDINSEALKIHIEDEDLIVN
ncbi:2909_t:CDS:1, partial [Funneliformis mosseae]